MLAKLDEVCNRGASNLRQTEAEGTSGPYPIFGASRKIRLGQLCEIVSGTTPKTTVPEYWGGTAKWITPAEINDDSFVICDTARKITELGIKKLAFRLSLREPCSSHHGPPSGKSLSPGAKCIATKVSKILFVPKKSTTSSCIGFSKAKPPI